MATYDYRCHSCGNEFLDVKQSIHDDPFVQCESCGDDSLKRIITGGGGFRIGGNGVQNPTAHLIVDTKLGRK